MSSKNDKRLFSIDLICYHKIMLASVSNKAKTIVIRGAILCITFFTYFSALQNEFVNWDDNVYVYENPTIRSIDIGFFKWVFTAIVSSSWHPLTIFSLALDYKCWGLDPFGYHLTNIILHLLNTLLVFILTEELIKIKGKDNSKAGLKATIVSTTTALLFGIHPLHVESVAWISERKDVLYAFFYLMAVLLYLKYAFSDSKKGKVKYYILCLFLFILSILSKPMAVTLPLIFLILDFYPLGRIYGKNTKAKKVYIEKIPFFVMSLIASIITVYSQTDALRSLEEYPLSYRFIVSMYSYFFYIMKMIFPALLAPFYPYPNASIIFSAHYLITFVIILGITIFSMWNLNKKKLFAACWLYYIVTLLPVVGIIKVGDAAAADRYTYLPSVGMFLLAGLGIATFFERVSIKTYKIVGVSIFLLLSVILIDKTVRQIAIWQDSMTLWTYQVMLYPDNALAYNHRGSALAKQGDLYRAMKDLNKAISLNPMHTDTYYNRGIVYNSLADFQHAISDFSMAIALNPLHTHAYYNRGVAYYKVNKYEEAILNFTKVILIDPGHIKAYNSRGITYASSGNHLAAINDFTTALRMNPRSAETYFNRGVAYIDKKQYDLAIEDLNKAIELSPAWPSAYHNRGVAYAQSGNINMALFNFKKACEMGDGLACKTFQKFMKEKLH